MHRLAPLRPPPHTRGKLRRPQDGLHAGTEATLFANARSQVPPPLKVWRAAVRSWSSRDKGAAEGNGRCGGVVAEERSKRPVLLWRCFGTEPLFLQNGPAKPSVHWLALASASDVHVMLAETAAFGTSAHPLGCTSNGACSHPPGHFEAAHTCAAACDAPHCQHTLWL